MTSENVIERIVEAKASWPHSLKLRKMGLTSLPSELFLFTDLIALDLSCNALTALPPEISKFSKLTHLNICGNNFTSLPPELFQLETLIALGLSELELSALPQEIFRLKNLKVLYLHNNRLTSLPPELFRLENLQELTLSDNQLTSLPPEISQLKNLVVLHLHHNNLTSLPPEIYRLSQLTDLLINDNPILSPPPEILNRGIEAIRLHFSFRQCPTQPLNEVKVVVIGDRAAGKTSLVKQLLGEHFDKNAEATRGINIRIWEPEIDGRKIKVNLWEFGGSDIMHASHPLFMSRRSVYILVLDRPGDERMEYWLQHIKTFGGNSPVLVVLNKQDDNPGFTVNQSSLRERHHNIHEFFHTSCKIGVGIPTFKEVLLSELVKVETIATRWTEPWFSVKLRIEQIQQPWIDRKKYLALCREERINNEKTCDMLVEFLHDLGVIVHFKNLITDDHMYLLDPTWVTNAVYMIVAAPELLASRGLLSSANFFKILWKNDVGQHSCPQEMHPYIVRLLQQLELCCEFDEEFILLPQLLPVSEPQVSFEQRGSLRFIFYYPEFLPPSILPSLIVKAHKDIKKRTCWRTGVLLEDRRGDAHALIKADIKTRQIIISVQGKRRREYLHYLRYLLSSINSRFGNLKVTERVPVPDARNVSADYATLLEYAKNGMDKYIPSGSAKVYGVHELLSVVQPKNKEELLNMLQKIDKQLDSKGDIAKGIKTMFELNPNTAGIGLNMNELFARILAWTRQQAQ